MQHVVAAGDRLRPAGVLFQIGDEEGESAARFAAPPACNMARTSVSRLSERTVVRTR